MKFSSGAFALLLLACASKDPSSGQTPASPQPPVVARVGGTPITVQQFKNRLEEQPPMLRVRYTTVERKKEFLESLVRVELLAQEARRQGLDKDPEVLATLEKLMVQRLLQKRAAELEKQPVSEEELGKYYREHLADFTRPEQVRIRHVFLAAAPPQRAQVKAEAARLLAELRRPPAGLNPSSFEGVVRKRSDDPATKATDGDLGSKSREELTALWGPQLAQAAFSLEAKDALAEVETERGIHLIQLLQHEASHALPFEEARPHIEARLRMEQRSHAIDTLIAELKKSTPVELNEQALEQVDVKEEAPARQGLPQKP